MIPIEFWEALVAELAAGRPAFLAVVVESTPGSPGTPGAAMLVRADGTQAGTIGGGLMEYNILAAAGQVLAGGDFAPRLELLWHRQDAPGTPSGMICAGSQTNLYCRCEPQRDLPVFREALTVAGAGETEDLVFTAQGAAVRPGRPKPDAPPIAVDRDGWEVRVRLAGQRRIAILGGGHCGRAISHVLRRLNYLVTVFDTRADTPVVIDNPDAHECVIVGDYADAGERIAHPESTAVVVLTADYASDVRALTGVLPLPFPFIGAMGSAAKLNRIRAELRTAGFTDADLARLRAPVGLPIGSHSPEEIAISIAAQLILEASRARPGRGGGPTGSAPGTPG